MCTTDYEKYVNRRVHGPHCKAVININSYHVWLTSITRLSQLVFNKAQYRASQQRGEEGEGGEEDEEEEEEEEEAEEEVGEEEEKEEGEDEGSGGSSDDTRNANDKYFLERDLEREMIGKAVPDYVHLKNDPGLRERMRCYGDMEVVIGNPRLRSTWWACQQGLEGMLCAILKVDANQKAAVTLCMIIHTDVSNDTALVKADMELGSDRIYRVPVSQLAPVTRRKAQQNPSRPASVASSSSLAAAAEEEEEEEDNDEERGGGKGGKDDDEGKAKMSRKKGKRSKKRKGRKNTDKGPSAYEQLLGGKKDWIGMATGMVKAVKAVGAGLADEYDKMVSLKKGQEVAREEEEAAEERKGGMTLAQIERGKQRIAKMNPAEKERYLKQNQRLDKHLKKEKVEAEAAKKAEKKRDQKEKRLARGGGNGGGAAEEESREEKVARQVQERKARKAEEETEAKKKEASILKNRKEEEEADEHDRKAKAIRDRRRKREARAKEREMEEESDDEKETSPSANEAAKLVYEELIEELIVEEDRAREKRRKKKDREKRAKLKKAAGVAVGWVKSKWEKDGKITMQRTAFGKGAERLVHILIINRPGRDIETVAAKVSKEPKVHLYESANACAHALTPPPDMGKHAGNKAP